MTGWLYRDELKLPIKTTVNAEQYESTYRSDLVVVCFSAIQLRLTSHFVKCFTSVVTLKQFVTFIADRGRRSSWLAGRHQATSLWSSWKRLSATGQTNSCSPCFHTVLQIKLFSWYLVMMAVFLNNINKVQERKSYKK